MAKKGKKQVFSKVAAVKANARERVGQPKPERVLDAEPRGSRQERKHKPTLQEILNQQD